MSTDLILRDLSSQLSYLLINNSYLSLILNTVGKIDYKDYNTHLPTLFNLLTLEFNLPKTLFWFEGQFPKYNKTFVKTIVCLPYSQFRNKFLKYFRHNERYETHLYHDFIVRAHCTKPCDICKQKDQELNRRIDKALDNFKGHFSFDFSTSSSDIQCSSFLKKTVIHGILCHKCSTEHIFIPLLIE